MADSGWMARAKSVAKDFLGIKSEATTSRDSELGRADSTFGFEPVSVSILHGTGRRVARSRTAIYSKWHYMSGDPVVSAALRAHITVALTGDERTGQAVFIEPVPGIEKDKTLSKIAHEIKEELEPLFNKIAHQVAFNATAFGDAYGRVYSKKGVGIQDVYVGEMVFPPLVQPYEKGSATHGFVISTGDKFTERLSITQMVRMEMPRMLYTPSNPVMEKALRTAITEDDIDALPLLPALAGGSFLDGAEEAYDNLMSALAGLVGQRILNSMDESMIGANLEGMTLEQRKEFMASLKAMLIASKERAAKAVKDGKPVTERSYHIIPTFSEKQMTSISQFNGTSGASSISIEDVLFHAKLLAGALGTDLAMLGFSEILSGGLGDGGFFRTSTQSAEKSRIIRTALAKYFNDLIDLHTLAKYGYVFAPKDKPFSVNFYGANSAVQAEKQASAEKAMNATSIMLTAVNQLKDLGLGPDVNRQILEKSMELDSDLAELIAKSIPALPPPDEGGEDNQFGH